MTRIVGFDVQTLLQVFFQLFVVIIAIFVIVKLMTLLILYIGIARKKSKLLDMQIAESEKKSNVHIEDK